MTPRKLTAWERNTLKVVVQGLPYLYREEGIRLKGEAYFAEHDLDQLRLMRLHDAARQDRTSEHYKDGICKDLELVERFRHLALESTKLANQYAVLLDYVREHGIPEDIRTSWKPYHPPMGMFG